MTSTARTVVWIVDDAESVRKSIAAVLATADLAVRDFASARDFLDVFTPEMAGCLIVDHHMPDMSGLALLQHLQALNIRIPAIVITADGDNALERDVIDAGAVMMLHKPVDGDELIELIAQVMANEA